MQSLLAPVLAELLGTLRELIVAVDDKLQQATQRLEQSACPAPCGFGALTTELVRREVGDWHRFANRRQVASLTGLCPGVRASGPRQRTGPITRHGNPRLRRALVELAWRVIRYQPDYGPVRHWRSKLLGNSVGARKKAVVAIARHLAIDQWRLATGRATCHTLGLKTLTA